jgi:hypothetical protein
MSPCILVSAGAFVLVLGTFLPWVASGSAERNSYDLVGIVGRLGFSTSGPFDLAVRLWALVPMCAAVAVAAVWWGWRLVGAVAGAVAAAYAGAVAASVLLAPQVGLVRVLVGVPVTLAGVVVLLGGSLAAAWSTRRRAVSPG